MQTADFDYILPTEFIAQTPVEPRDSAKLFVFHRSTGCVEHLVFHDLPLLLKAGDVLVLNQTRVIRARLFGRKIPSQGKVEILLLKQLEATYWEALVGGKGLAEGKEVQLDHGPLARIVSVLEGSRRVVKFSEPMERFLEESGHVPLPPYIHHRLENAERYQTVFSKIPGSAAAPTAGLHFTQTLLDRILAQGVKVATVTLHVGLDTFQPVTEDDPASHLIHSEWCSVDSHAVEAIQEARRNGGRVIAVGTTSVRTLESAARQIGLENVLKPFEGATNLYILPGFEFKVVQGLITNYHLPRSTLIMLVSAFMGRGRVLAAYRLAQEMQYRFYSFGDAMLIL